MILVLEGEIMCIEAREVKFGLIRFVLSLMEVMVVMAVVIVLVNDEGNYQLCILFGGLFFLWVNLHSSVRSHTGLSLAFPVRGTYSLQHIW